MKEDADLAIKAAKDAFYKGPWRKMDAADRAKLIHKFADLIEKNEDELANLEAQDNGKPFLIAKNVDIW